jgi:hypothetical protein
MKTKKKIKGTVLLLIITVFVSCSISKVMIPTPEPTIKNVTTNSTKNSNFIKANEWMVQTFNNAKSVIQFKDKDAGIVKGKYVMKEGFVSTNQYVMSEPDFFSVITIRVKDSMSRIEVDAPSGMYSQKAISGVELGFTKELFLVEANKLIEKFEIYMKAKSSNDNW